MSDTIQLHISGMDCADCAYKLEQGVAGLEGIAQCQVNFAAATMKIAGDVDQEALVNRVRSMGYEVIEASQAYQPQTRRQQVAQLLRRPRNVYTLIGVGFILFAFAALGLARLLMGVSVFAETVAIILFFTGGLFGLYFPVKLGWAALRNGQGLDMNVLMSIAAISAFAIGEFAEAAAVIVLFSLGEALEGYTMERARDSIRSLTGLAPQRAIRLSPCMDCDGHLGQSLPDGSGIYQSGPCPWCGLHEQETPVEDLAIGERIIVKPGERIPMDGRVASGHSAVNQAPITGESMPVEKGPESEVFAGTVNGDGALEIEVTRLAADNTLARMIYLVEEAQAQKTPTQQFVDKFARVYTPLAVLGAILVAALPPLLFSQPFLDTPTTRGWLYRALTMLVIACPCALVIATPVAVVSAISTAARRGVLIKGGAYLEALGRLKVMAFDKTGTLTRGEPAVVGVYCADNCCNGTSIFKPLTPCDCCNDMLTIAAAVERHSAHPLAQAVTAAAEARKLPRLTAEGVQNLPGRGVQGWVNKRLITVGSHTLLHSATPELADFCEGVNQTEANGHTAMLVREEDTLHGYLAVSDPPRPGSRRAVAALKEAGIVHTVMLTGDNRVVAQAVAQEVGVDEVRANLLPEDKIEAVKLLRETYGDVVAMVGDGVNDAPALAAASVGIAMGGVGSAQAIETADVALMSDDLIQLPFALQLGRRAAQIIRFNIYFALGIKAIFLVAALFGVATLWMAVFADMGASLIVTLNGMRLLRRS